MAVLDVDVQTDNSVPMTGHFPIDDLEIQHNPPAGATSLAGYEDTLQAWSESFPVRLVIADFSPWVVDVVNVNGTGPDTSWGRDNDLCQCWFDSAATINPLQVFVTATDAVTTQTRTKTIYIKIRPKSERPVPG
jgi:hypothetical protein